MAELLRRSTILATACAALHCYAVPSARCELRCGQEGCPDDMECRADGYCHAPSDAALCATSDAPPTCPDSLLPAGEFPGGALTGWDPEGAVTSLDTVETEDGYAAQFCKMEATQKLATLHAVVVPAPKGGV